MKKNLNKILFFLWGMIFAPALQGAKPFGTDVTVTGSNDATKNKTGEQKNGTGDAGTTATPPGRVKKTIKGVRSLIKTAQNKLSARKEAAKKSIGLIKAHYRDQNKATKETREKIKAISEEYYRTQGKATKDAREQARKENSEKMKAIYEEHSRRQGEATKETREKIKAIYEKKK